MNKKNSKGQQEGYWERYCSNGQLMYKGHYSNGQLEGYWERYWSNGQLNWKGYYSNGQGHGFWETGYRYKFYLT